MSLSIRRLVLIALFSLATLSSLGHVPSPSVHKSAVWIWPEPLITSPAQR